MYFRMLKNDLKRKKTLNVILLIFIILAATFIASGINSILTTTKALDNYFDKAEIAPCIFWSSGNQDKMRSFLKENDNVKSFKEDEQILVSNGNFPSDENVIDNSGIISPINIKQQKFFDENDNIIESIKDGELYMPSKSFINDGFKVGDKVTVKSGKTKMTFTIKGKVKDATMGSALMGVTRLVISDNDYKKLDNSGDFGKMQLYSVNTDDINAVRSDMLDEGITVENVLSKELISTTYLMDIIISGVLLVVSICLIIISLIIMRFTIVFTLQEEFREIGIMKAIGIKENKIRGLYIIKYLALALIGSIIGFILSIPFGNMFIAQSSENMIISGVSNIFVNAFSCVLLVAIVVFFCYLSTRRVGKFSPVDAVRSGSTGERFRRKGLLHLSKSHMRPVAFLAVNDILSSLKTFTVLILIFILGILLLIVPINTISTLKSDQLVRWFSISESDLYLSNDDECLKLQKKGEEYIKNYLKGIEKKLSDSGIKCKGDFEILNSVGVSHNDKNTISLSFKGIGTTIDQYDYIEGTAPKNDNEIAITHITANEIDAKIGDTVTIKYDDKEKDFIVTALYQSMNSLGQGVRFNEKTDFIKSAHGMISFAVQIKYTDNPSEKEKQSRREIVEKLYPEFKVYSGGEYVSYMMGDTAEQIEDIKLLIFFVVLIINMLVSALMVKTFLIKEKGEIAMLKSIGFKNSDVIKRQILRIGIVLFLAILIAILISDPISQITTGKVFEFMGASHIDFVPNVYEGFILYPILLFAATMLASAITALGAKKIKSSEINNID